MLEIITFTGVDENTDLEELRDVSARYPRAEFAVLFGSQTWEDNPIFPPPDTVRKLKSLQGVRTAIHLCGRYARRANGEKPTGGATRRLVKGFGRVQVNLHPDGDDPRRIDIDPGAMERLAQETETGSVILQHRGGWDETPVDHPGIEYLFDLSGGAGKESFELWPDPPAGRRVGYAGGLGPHNIRRAMEFVDRHPHARIWLDMERNVRTPDYRLDLEKVREVCRLALDGKEK